MIITEKNLRLQIRKVLTPLLNEAVVGDWVLMSQNNVPISNITKPSITKNLAPKEARALFQGRKLPANVKGVFRVVGFDKKTGEAILARANARTGNVSTRMTSAKNLVRASKNSVSKAGILYKGGVRGSKTAMGIPIQKAQQALGIGKGPQLSPRMKAMGKTSYSPGGYRSDLTDIKTKGPTINKAPSKAATEAGKLSLKKNPILDRKLTKQVDKFDDALKLAKKPPLTGPERELAKARLTALHRAPVPGMTAPPANALSKVATGTARTFSVRGAALGIPRIGLAIITSTPVTLLSTAWMGWEIGSAIDSWLTGNMKDIIVSVKKSAKIKLGLTFGPRDYDTTDDNEFRQAAQRAGYKGLKPKALDPDRRKQILDLLVQLRAIEEMGVKMSDLKMTDNVVRVKLMLRNQYLDNRAWRQLVDRTLRQEKKKEDLVITVVPPEPGPEEAKPKPGPGPGPGPGPSPEPKPEPEPGPEEEEPKKPATAAGWDEYIASKSGKSKENAQQVKMWWIGGNNKDPNISAAAKAGVSDSFMSWARWYQKTRRTGDGGNGVTIPDGAIIGGKKWNTGDHLSPRQLLMFMRQLARS